MIVVLVMFAGSALLCCGIGAVLLPPAIQQAREANRRQQATETGPFSSRTIRVKVIGLGDPDDEPMIDDLYGILCEARHERNVVTLSLGELEVKKGKPNRKLVADYGYWFWNWR
jgi:hypothetical protein